MEIKDDKCPICEACMVVGRYFSQNEELRIEELICPNECFYYKNYYGSKVYVVDNMLWEIGSHNKQKIEEVKAHVNFCKINWDKTPEEAKAFRRALIKDHSDLATRKVYADYLEEHGLDDEALIQREWDYKKVNAENALRDYAKECNVPYILVYTSLNRYFLTGEQFVENGSEGLRTYYTDSILEYWKILTDNPNKEDPEKENDWSMPFSCSC